MVPAVHRRAFFGVLAGVVWVLSDATGFCQTGSAVPPFADDVPATAAICVWSDDTRQLADGWQQTALFQVYAADAMRSFWTGVRQRRGGLLPHEQLGLPWDEFTKVCGGAWVLAYDFQADGQGTLLIVDVQGKETVAVSVLGGVQQRWQDRGLAVTSQAYPWGNVVAGTGNGEERWAFVRGGRLYMTDRARLAKRLLTRAEGKTETSLATAEIFPTLAAAAPAATPASRGTLRFFVDPWRLAQDVAGSAKDATAKRTAFLERHGFRAIRAFVGYAEFHRGGNDAEFVVRVPVTFPLTDAAGLLSFTSSRDFGLSPLIPLGAVGVACFHGDVMRAFRAYGFVYDDVYGENYAGAFDDLLNGLAQDPDGPEVDLRAELFETLSGKISRCFDYGGQVTATNPSGRRELWVTESTAPEKAARAVARFFRNDPDVTSSSVNQVQIWHSRTDGPLLGGDPENPLAVRVDGLGIVRGHLVLATDRQMVRSMAEATSGTARPFSDALWQASLSTDAIAQSWRNLVPVANTLHRCLQQGRMPEAGTWEEGLVWFLLSTETPRGRELAIDATLLPAFSAIENQFGLERMEVSMDQQGWLLHGQLTRPK